MNETTPASEGIEVVCQASRSESDGCSPERVEQRTAYWDQAEEIRRTLGILDGQVTLTFVDDGT